MRLKQQLATAALALTVGAAAATNTAAKEESPLFGKHDYTQADGKKVSISTIRIDSNLGTSGSPLDASNTLKTTVTVDGKPSTTGVFACAARSNYGPHISTGEREANNDSASAHINSLLPAGTAADQEARATALRVGAFVVIGNCLAPAIKAPGLST